MKTNKNILFSDLSSDERDALTHFTSVELAVTAEPPPWINKLFLFIQQGIPEQNLNLFMLHYAEALSFSEIAHFTKLSPQICRNRILYTQKKITKRIKALDKGYSQWLSFLKEMDNAKD